MERFCSYVLSEVKKVAGSLSLQVQISNPCFASKVAKVSSFAVTISASTLEASTVDLASEFTNMIRFQRAYSAASKIITTADEMLREVSDLKR